MAKAAEKKAGMIDRSKYEYETIRYKDPKTGKVRTSTGTGDAIARAMLGLDHAAIVKAAKANGLGDLAAKHENASNEGQFRMTIGNAFRGLVRKGTPVTIGDNVIKSLDQRVKVEEAPAPEPREKAKSKKAA